MTGVALIIAFVLAIIVMIVAISKFKVHPFLAIMAVSLILARDGLDKTIQYTIDGSCNPGTGTAPETFI